MKALGKMIHFEIHRFRFVLGALMALTAICQFGLILWATLAERSLRESDAWRLGEARSKYGVERISFDDILFGMQMEFALPIFVSIAVIGIYIFGIWYRDWFGKSAFIYRLLMLPMPRWNLYLAKLIAILAFIFCLLAFQLLLLVLEAWMFRALLPAEYWEASHFSEAIDANEALKMLLPRNFDAFLLSYGLGTIGVIVVFTAIVIERSYRKRGIVFGLLYAAVCAIAVLVPMPLLDFGSAHSRLYPGEVVAMELAVCALVVAGSIALAFRLLRRKVGV